MFKIVLSKYNIVNTIVNCIIFSTTVAFVLSMDYSSVEFLPVFLLMLIGAISFYNIITSEKNVDLRRTMYIFFFFFFFMAPLQQYTTGTVLWRSTGLKTTYTSGDYARSAFAVLLLILFFEIGYSKSKFLNKKKQEKTVVEGVQRLRSYTYVILLFVSSFAFAILLLTDNIKNTNHILGTVEINSQFVNVLRYLPVCSLLIILINCSCYGFKNKVLYIILIVTQVLILFFPFWGSMPRYILLGTYVVFYTFFFSKSKYKSVYFLIFFLGFGFTFSSFRSSDSFRDIMNEVAFNFNHADFDAYQMLMATIRYTDETGMVYGKNILSALMFIVPRAIWKGKMESTGSLVARFFGSRQENVSSPLVGEFYFAASWIGIFVLGWAFGNLANCIDKFDKTDSYIKKITFCIFSGMMTYIQRGSLLATLAFTGGLLVATTFIYLLTKIRFE